MLECPVLLSSVVSCFVSHLAHSLLLSAAVAANVKLHNNNSNSNNNSNKDELGMPERIFGQMLIALGDREDLGYSVPLTMCHLTLVLVHKYTIRSIIISNLKFSIN